MCEKIGIDLGGTKIEGVALDAQGNEIDRIRIPTGQEYGYEHVLNNIQKVYLSMRSKLSTGEHTFGIGTPGATSPKTGKLRNSNTLCLNGKRLHDDLEDLLDHRVEIQNDANCFAMAEALFGAGKHHKMVFGVILGTGCGGGVVIDKKVHTGSMAIAGEWGHMVLNPEGPECYCGNRGCVETYLSGGGLEKLYSERYGTDVPFHQIADNYYKGNKHCIEFISEFLAHFGQAMANLINILDPDVVVIGGGLSNFDALYSQGTEAIANVIFCDYFDTPVVKNKLGDSAGVIGAALIGK